MKSKKSQIKMAENIGVLAIFFILIVLSIIFYTAFQRTSIEEQVSELKTRNAVQLASKVALLPEFQCNEEQSGRTKYIEAYFRYWRNLFQN